MVLYMAPVSAEVQNVSSEEMKKGMESWVAWFKKGGKAFVDTGTPLGNGLNVAKKGSSKGKTEVTGYSIVQAENIEKVKAMLADCPHLMMPKASIEVLEMMPM
jgi:hypothetical protein